MQLATLAIVLISATALWSGVQALNEQARNSYDRAAAAFGGARVAMLVAQQDSTFPQRLFVDLRRAGWPVSPVLEGRIRIQGKTIRLLGIEPVTFPAKRGRFRRSDDPTCSRFSRRRAKRWWRQKHWPNWARRTVRFFEPTTA